MAVNPRFAGRALKKASLEQSEFLETNDETSGDGDSSLKQLKKQALLDRKALLSLSMDLEEERSATAFAANIAMALITRLHVEKASIQMEALQYQRMMEEQAEYDQEAIQILQDMLAKRDEQVRVMESELKSCREKHGDIRKVGMDEREAEADEYYHEWRSQSSSSFGEKSLEPGTPFEHAYEEPTSMFRNEHASSSTRSHCRTSVENEGNTYEEPLLDFENEKHQLYSMLRDIENHIELSSMDDEREDEYKDTVVDLQCKKAGQP